MASVIIVILTLLSVASILFGVYCWAHYHLQKRDFIAYQKIAETNNDLAHEQYHYLCDLLEELRDVIKDVKEKKE
jgi:hypothetical protein